MTLTQYRYCFLSWMYILLNNPSKEEFCAICKITDKEIQEFLFTDYPFPVQWLMALYEHASTPKDLAFISFFIKKLYGETPEKKDIKVPKSYNRCFITGADIQSLNKSQNSNQTEAAL